MSWFVGKDVPDEEELVERQRDVQQIIEELISSFEAYEEEFVQSLEESSSRKEVDRAITSLENVVIRYQDRIREIDKEHIEILKEAVKKLEGEGEASEIVETTRHNVKVLEEILRHLNNEAERLDDVFEEAETSFKNGDIEGAMVELENSVKRDERNLEIIREKFEEEWRRV